MEKICLSRKEYLDKVRGCWMGKNIGGTLGAPVEGRKYTHAFTYFDWKASREWLRSAKSAWEKSFGVSLAIDPETWQPGQPLPNDDLDFQLVWVKMLEDRGVNPTFKDFSDYWMKYLYRHWYAEYSYCIYNLQRGLKPPISGAFQNYFVDEMGSPIRSEIWACVAPGDPQLAASLAWMDSSMDHTGGEGRWGEMFWAAVESAAFVISDPKALIEIGLAMIPISSHIARSIREAVRCYEDGLSWGEARERIVTIFGHYNPCNAIPNHGFTIIGWLYGNDYGDKLCKAVNCGYDTDCTGATLGSVLGILEGASRIPEEWKKVVGNAITPCPMTITEGLPLTIDDLTSRTQKVAEKMISECSQTVEFADKTFIPEDIISIISNNEKIRDLLTFDIHSSVENIGDLDVIFHYGGEPVVHPGIKKLFEISFAKRFKPVRLEGAKVKIKAPSEWILSDIKEEDGRFKFNVYAKKVEKTNSIEIEIKIKDKIEKLKFTVLGPDAVVQIPASTSAPKK